ncbi:MAG TPA: nucleotidyltransferase family protein [Burkholderiales bacterium]|nr:nucleotidyltransferase family protein [Burkholderiales bacterium]
MSYLESFPAAILAGGLATRLHPVTRKIPKALIEVSGKPFICRQLDYLSRQGIVKVVVCVGYLGEQIEAAVGNGHASGLTVQYSHDGPTLLGTGGALRQALPLLGERFFVLNGDSYLPCDFRAVQQAFLQSSKPALMTVLHNEDQWDKSNVSFRDGRIVEYNKSAPRPEMAYIDYGLGILSAAALESYPKERAFDLSDVYHELSLADQLAGFEVSERFYEIGSPQGLKETEAYFSAREIA